MKLLFLLAAAVIVVVARPPNAGNAAWVGDLRYEPNGDVGEVGFTRYVRFPQDPVNKEWEQIGTSFTIEFWAMWFRPMSTDDGHWDLNLSPFYNETRFIPLVTRHPGLMLNNEWAHFHVQITRTRRGGVINAWTGCGCDAPPEIDPSTGEQVNLDSCGLGYLLYSDHPMSIGGEWFFPPEEWHHFAFTFDGDGSDRDAPKTHKASMYIDGNLKLTNTWNDPNNNPTRKNVCAHRSMNWFRSDLGQMNEIRFGYLDNQDSPDRVDSEGNPVEEFEVYGLNGALDEVRIWRSARSARQIKEYYDLSLTSDDIANAPFLSLYTNFNQGPILETVPNSGSAMTRGHIYTSPNAPAANFLWNVSITADDNWLTINNRQYIVAKRPETAGNTLYTRFMFRGFDGDPLNEKRDNIPDVDQGPWEGFAIRIVEFSPKLRTEMAAGRFRLSRYPSGAVIDDVSKAVQLIQHDEEVQVEAFCSDTYCSNFVDSEDNFRNWNIRYVAQQDPLTDAETPVANLFVTIEADCDGLFDACGVCQGHNETCQCVVYHNFRNVRMAYVLLVHMVDYLIEKVTATTEVMDETLDVINSDNFDPAAVSSELTAQIEDMMKFYNGCLADYCSAVSQFNNLLKMYGPQALKRDELPEIVEGFADAAAQAIGDL